MFDAQGGKLLNAAGLKLLKAQLWEKYGVKLRLIDKEVGSSEMRKLLKDWDRRDVVGRFREGPPPEMILRAANASELTVFHEMTHLEIWYNKLPKMHLVEEEKMVWEAIWKTKEKWTVDELVASYNYVNRKVRDFNDLGKNFPYLVVDEMEQIIYNKRLGIK